MFRDSRKKMQSRRRKPFIIMAFAGVFVGGFAFLMLHEVPAPQQRVEQKLDAGKFLNRN